MDSAYHVWVNGKKIGYSQGSRNAAEFDISNVIRKDEVNTLRVKVYQWSDGSYIEDQDMWVCISRTSFPTPNTVSVVGHVWGSEEGNTPSCANMSFPESRLCVSRTAC